MIFIVLKTLSIRWCYYIFYTAGILKVVLRCEITSWSESRNFGSLKKSSSRLRNRSDHYRVQTGTAHREILMVWTPLGGLNNVSAHLKKSFRLPQLRESERHNPLLHKNAPVAGALIVGFYRCFISPFDNLTVPSG